MDSSMLVLYIAIVLISTGHKHSIYPRENPDQIQIQISDLEQISVVNRRCLKYDWLQSNNFIPME